ncbi:hypothetical protein GMES_1132 [Paraglaciecola mesophila KMM 241]|uniref:Uncharacterized protein n=1 Tax=Paraglaciecola mesophila KMM 241 TaxID=1128912 RepID=K6YHI1_9ALTE|nr:hypothetical protein GMES_1132 [Paraglaciecola mesophila KMM 241]
MPVWSRFISIRTAEFRLPFVLRGARNTGTPEKLIILILHWHAV